MDFYSYTISLFFFINSFYIKVCVCFMLATVVFVWLQFSCYIFFLSFNFLKLSLLGWHWLIALYISFKCTTLWYIICALYYVFTTQSLGSLHHHKFDPFTLFPSSDILCHWIKSVFLGVLCLDCGFFVCLIIHSAILCLFTVIFIMHLCVT